MACLRKCPRPNGTCTPVLTRRSSPTCRTLQGPEPTGTRHAPKRGGDPGREPRPTVTIPECCNADLVICQSAGELNFGLGSPRPPPYSSCLLDVLFKRFSTCQFMFTSAHRTDLGNAPRLEMTLITHLIFFFRQPCVSHRVSTCPYTAKSLCTCYVMNANSLHNGTEAIG